MQKRTRFGLLMVVAATLMLVAASSGAVAGGMCQSIGDFAMQCVCETTCY
ncbi:hypothetical protein [Halorussus lipolyticus]|nr:hypothetical protein [Halorussus sp. DT80]